MSELGYVLKISLATFLFVGLLQVKIGGDTIEQHSYAWMKQSVLVEQLQKVADGAVAVTSTGYKKASGWIGSKLHAKKGGEGTGAGERKLLPAFERSHAVKESQERAREKSQDARASLAE